LFAVYEIGCDPQRFDHQVPADIHKLTLNTKRIDGSLELLNQFLGNDYRPGDDF
jgi:hypothetical protein